MCPSPAEPFLQLPSSERVIDTGEGLAEFWRGQGTKRFRLVSVVARSVLGAPGCAAVVEDGFETGGWPVIPSRGPRDGAYAEMVMFLRGTFSTIPKEVPVLSAEQVRWAMPRRLRSPQMRLKLRDLAPTEDGLAGDGACRSTFGFGFGDEIDSAAEDGADGTGE